MSSIGKNRVCGILSLCLPFNYFTMTVALRQADAVKNTGISCPTSSQGFTISLIRAGLQYFSSSNCVLQKIYSRQELLRGLGLPSYTRPHSKSTTDEKKKKTGSRLPCLYLLIGRAVAMLEKASQEEANAPLRKKEYHF